ncbi:MAG: siderophore-interacting protein, partial [Ensifer adhaerens]|nr:siderophore-interacting protein [Ensifer adhaerens]
MDNSPNYSDLPTPRIERVRHELKRRSLVVSGIERVTPG